ncbi:hypothetical protein CAP35_01170 [Chitinophagaceae bacterium IBVUCB1]|nr:hypothetical protein CAP35_01170 [Chitinophagaceae bacterium IBVUCB1]
MDYQSQHNNDWSAGEVTTLWTVASGTIGGVYKAQAMPKLLLNSLTADGSMAVVAYAFISAVVGYCTKKGLDYLFVKCRKKR